MGKDCVLADVMRRKGRTRFKCAREEVGRNAWPCRMLSRDGLGCFLGAELEAILEEDGGRVL